MSPQQPCTALLPSPLAAARWKNRKDVWLQIGQQPLSKGSHLVRFTHTCISSTKKKKKWTTLVKQLDRSCKHTSSWTNWWEKCSVVQNVTLQVLITPPCKPQTPISRWLFTTTWSTRADHNVYKSDYYGPSTALVLLSFKHGRVWRCFWPVLYFCNKAVVRKPKSESCSTWGGQAD